MVNKNDLRYIKTERLIVHTYVDLRLRDPSPVKVSDLCREALINKTTFYSHYDTMESLHRHICRETVADILGRCDCAQMAFSDTYAFVSELVGAISREERLIRALYGDDVTSLLNDAEEALFRIYLHDDDEPERKEKIIFCIGGTSRLLLMNPDEHGIRARPSSYAPSLISTKTEHKNLQRRGHKLFTNILLTIGAHICIMCSVLHLILLKTALRKGDRYGAYRIFF